MQPKHNLHSAALVRRKLFAKFLDENIKRVPDHKQLVTIYRK